MLAYAVRHQRCHQDVTPNRGSWAASVTQHTQISGTAVRYRKSPTTRWTVTVATVGLFA